MNKTLNRNRILMFGVVAALTFVGTANADVMGSLGLGSSGYVQATLTSINWTADASAIGVCSPNPCNADVDSATTLLFTGGPLGLREGVEVNGGFPFGSPPPAGATIFNPFLQFASHPNLLYFLTGVFPGSSNTNCAGLANGQSCSINVAGTPSPVILTATGNGTATRVSIDMFGFASDAGAAVCFPVVTAACSSWTGGFSATIAGITPQGLLLFFCPDGTCDAADVAAGNRRDVLSVSGSFIATVPETDSTFFFTAELGLVALGVKLKKRLAA